MTTTSPRNRSTLSRPTIALFAGLMAMLCVDAALVAAPQKAKPRAARKKKAAAEAQVTFPPTLPGESQVITDTSPAFLKPPSSLKDGVSIARTPPTIDFLYYPGQDYEGKPWSNWGDGTAVNGKYYSAIGDHLSVGGKETQHGTGTALVYEYDADSKTIRTVFNAAEFLKLPEGHYTPGKIHSRVDMGRDGWLYFATHRGSPKQANDAHHYAGDWVFRTNPESGQSEVVVHAPVPKHSIPNSVLDPERLIFYGATAAGPDAELQEIAFFAYDVKNRKLLYSGSNGPARYMMLARSTGRLYYVPGSQDGELLRYDPSVNAPPVGIGQTLGVRAATEETADGFVYTVSTGQKSGDAALWQFNTQTERAEQIGTIAVGTEAYVASIDVDPTGRFLYYVPGAHGGGPRDGSPLVQYDIKSGKKKVIAFLHPYYEEKYGFTPKGTYSTAVSPAGDKVYITWNVSRGTRAWDCCGLAVVHIPESERTP